MGAIGIMGVMGVMSMEQRHGEGVGKTRGTIKCDRGEFGGVAAVVKAGGRIARGALIETIFAALLLSDVVKHFDKTADFTLD